MYITCFSLYRDTDFHARFHFDHYELSGSWHGEFTNNYKYLIMDGNPCRPIHCIPTRTPACVEWDSQAPAGHSYRAGAVPGQLLDIKPGVGHHHPPPCTPQVRLHRGIGRANSHFFLQKKCQVKEQRTDCRIHRGCKDLGFGYGIW